MTPNCLPLTDSTGYKGCDVKLLNFMEIEYNSYNLLVIIIVLLNGWTIATVSIRIMFIMEILQFIMHDSYIQNTLALKVQKHHHYVILG